MLILTKFFLNSVDLKKLDIAIIDFTQDFFSKLILLIMDYLPLYDRGIEAFQLLDARKRNTISTSSTLFRDYLLKKFVTCYEFKDYNDIYEEYVEFMETADIDLPVKIENYISPKSGNIKVEEFWLERNIQENWKWKKLSKFFTNLLLIPASNMFVESMFSYINLIKSPTRNLLQVGSVASILKTKSYYLK